jgi:hypothetical protein
MFIVRLAMLQLNSLLHNYQTNPFLLFLVSEGNIVIYEHLYFPH